MKLPPSTIGTLPGKAPSKKEKRLLQKFARALNSIASMKKNVAAVNYVLPGENLWSSQQSLKGSENYLAGNDVSSFDSNCATPSSSRKYDEIVENTEADTRVRHLVEENSSPSRNAFAISPEQNETCPTSSHARAAKRSRRNKKEPQRYKDHVKYSMTKTPQFKRNLAFLREMRSQCAILRVSQGEPMRENTENKEPSDNCSIGDIGSREGQNLEGRNSPMGDSIIWCPKNREEWFDCSTEMETLCVEGALRSALSQKFVRPLSGKNGQRPKFLDPSPISKEYVRDRLDIDDPLNGFQIRHAKGGWLQGFVLWTTFTTWTRYFKWDSLHLKSGMSSSNSVGTKMDKDGKLSAELEAEPRAGDPLQGGVIWSTVAEIGLIGALGCGEYLLRMAMDDICRKGCYKFVVLQATESSLGFYERLGFTRVGAICKYKGSKVVSGYRHWTYADEKDITTHGGPSYMMTKKITTVEPERGKVSRVSDEYKFGALRTGVDCAEYNAGAFLDSVRNSFVEQKPAILSVSKQNQLYQSETMPSVDDWIRQLCVEDYLHEKNAIRLPENRAENSRQDSFRSSVQSAAARKRKEKRDSCGVSLPLQDSNKRIRISSESLSPTKDMINRGTTKRNSTPVVANCTKSLSGGCFDHRLRKQRFTDRNCDKTKPFFFNKVVARVDEERTSESFFFVLHYYKESQTMRLIQLVQQGTFTGKREGRVKWKADMTRSDAVRTVSCLGWEVVSSYTVTKTAYVQEESWDLLEDVIIKPE